jgi:hypothetical protein
VLLVAGSQTEAGLEMTATFTHGIRLEVAQAVLSALLAYWSEAAAHELDAANPDPGLLAEIEAEQRKLRSLRQDLDPRDAAQIESVIAEHAPLARRLYATV